MQSLSNYQWHFSQNKNKNLFLIELEAGKSKIKVLANPVSDEDQLPRLLDVTSPDGRGKGALSCHFYKGTNRIYEGSTLMAYSLPKAPPNL